MRAFVTSFCPLLLILLAVLACHAPTVDASRATPSIDELVARRLSEEEAEGFLVAARDAMRQGDGGGSGHLDKSVSVRRLLEKAANTIRGGTAQAKAMFLLAVMELNRVTDGARAFTPSDSSSSGRTATAGARLAAVANSYTSTSQHLGGYGDSAFRGTRLGRMVGSRLLTTHSEQSTLDDTPRRRAFDLFNRSAHLGNPDAHRILGTLYSTGLLGVRVDDVRALLHFRFAAMGENIGAAMSMGFRHLHGVGVTKNCSAAAIYYEIAANAAIDALGTSMVPSWRPPRLERLADSNKNSGRKADSEVLQYLRFAAEKGEKQAYEVLGLIHFHGTRGARRDLRKAKKMLLAAAEEHDSTAAYADLGHIVLHGLSDGLPILDAEEGAGQDRGEKEGERTDLDRDGWDWDFFSTRGDSSLSPATVVPNYALAYEYYKKAALQGNADGVNGLGYMHLHGLGVDKDWEKAVDSFERAAHDRSVDAIYNMGVVHLTPPQGPELAKLQMPRRAHPKKTPRSTGKEPHNEKAKRSTTRTAEPSSGPRVGGFNFKKSIAHFRVAARSGHVLAKHKLAHMALHGLGMEKPNCAEAVDLFKDIAESGPQAEFLSLAEHALANNAKGAALFWYSVAADMGFELAQANAAHLFEDLPAHVLKRLSMLDLVGKDNGTAPAPATAKTSRKSGESIGDDVAAMGSDGAHLESPGRGGSESVASADGGDVGGSFSNANTGSALTPVERVPFSLRMWKLAAKQKNVAANIRAGDVYFYGLQGIPVDFEQAAAHYRVATALGSPQAMFNLGWHYQYGVGLPVDFHLAKRYYDQAYETSPLEANVPSKLAFLSLWLYSSWVSSSSWTVMYGAMRESLNGYMRGGKWELALGDIPDVSAFSLGTEAPRLGRPPSSLTRLFAEEDGEILRVIAGLALLLGLLLVRSWRRAAVI